MDARQRRELFIAKVPSGGTASIADGVAFDFNLLALGEAVFVNINTGKVETDLTTAGRYKLWMKTSNGDALVSNVMDTNLISETIQCKYLAGIQKVDHIGSNGTTGSFPTADNQYYGVTIEIDDGSKARFGSPETLKAGYESNTGTTELEIVAALSKDLALQTYDQALKVEVISTDDGTANDAGVGTITVTKGSDKVTVATATGTNLIVGNAIRFGTGVTDPIYVIIAVNGLELTLHQVYQDANGTFVPDTETEYITAANITAGSLGIQITGTPNTEWKRNQREYFFSDWRTSVYGTGFDDAPLTIVKHTVLPVYPKNSGKEIADLENRTRQYFSGGLQNPEDSYTNEDMLREAVANSWYDTIDIFAKDLSKVGIAPDAESLYTVTLAVPGLNQKVVVTTATNSTVYTVTIDGITYSYTSDASATKAEIANGLAAAFGAGVIFTNDGVDTLYIQATDTITTTGATLTVSANTAMIYPSVATWFA